MIKLKHIGSYFFLKKCVYACIHFILIKNYINVSSDI